MELPKYPHCGIICGQTGCGKTEFVLDLLETKYKRVFRYIVILCPTIQWNKAYKNREWIGDIKNPKTKNLKIVNPIVKGEEKLQELLKIFFEKYAGYPTLYIIDDCSATKELTKKKDMLSELAFSGRHAEQSVWVISNVAIPRDFSGTEHADFSSDSGMFFIHNLFITQPILIRSGAEYPS
jgi:hypothetical protein